MRKIGLLGPEGTFCEVALNKYLNHVNLKEIDDRLMTIDDFLN